MADEKKAKRRLVDVVVDKISLVDTPAINEPFKIVKRLSPEALRKSAESDPEPVKKDAPVHEALLKEKIAGLQTAFDAFMGSVGDLAKMHEWSSKVRGMLWGVCDAMDAIPVVSPETTKAFSGLTKRACGVVEAFEAALKKDETGGSPMDKCPQCDGEMKDGKCLGCAEKAQKAEETKKAEDALVAKVTDGVMAALKAQGVVKRAEPELTPAEQKIADLTTANEALSKRLEALEKGGAPKAAGGDTPIVKSKKEWAGTPLSDYEGQQ